MNALHIFPSFVIGFQTTMEVEPMERQKRVYPARNMKWYMCILLLTVAVMVGYSGLFPKERNDGFSLQAAPAPSAVPLAVTVPPRAALTVCPMGAARSTPVCTRQSWVVGL